MTIDIPIIARTDLLVTGLTTGGVEAAITARAAGREVFMIGAESYPGADICATARYWLDPDQAPATPTAQALFGTALRDRMPVRPMTVKHGLESAMLDAGIKWLYLTHPVCLLRDDTGRLAGVVVANRSGFQAILAGALIDTTDRAVTAALAGARFRPFPAGTYAMERVTVLTNDRWQSVPKGGEPLPGTYQLDNQTFNGYRHTLALELADATPEAWARAEVEARLSTWHPGQIFASDRLFCLPPDRLDTGHPLADWTGPDALDPAALRCGDDPIFLLGPRADATDAVLTELLKPCHLMAAGQRLGAHVAELAAAPAADTPVRADYTAPAVDGIEVCRQDRYFRFDDGPGLPFDLNRFPVLATVDVAVAGGGTGGAPAAIAAGRTGGSAILLEMLPGLGGVGTEGRIASYYHGNRCGFTAELDRGVAALAPDPDFDIANGKWNSEWKKLWYLRATAAAGARTWFGSMAVAAAVDGHHVRGVLAATPCGVGLIRAKAVVDATGNADVAAAAGAQTVSISKAHVAVQGTGLSPVQPGAHYQNTDYTFVDDSDVMDVTRAFILARRKFSSFFDVAQIVDSRQRQQVEGELSLDPLDFLAQRTFPDTVVTARSNFDSHGFTIHPLFMAKPPDEASIDAHVPFRCLLPRGLEGILVTGLGVSSHRDALPVIRMQPDVQNQGYAAGRAAAMSAHEDRALRALDMRALQRHLVETGILDPAVLAHTDSFPLAPELVAAAVDGSLDDYRELAVIFGNRDAALPLLREAYAAADGARALRLAHLLGLLGDATGVETLMAHVDAQPWDQGWDFRGMGQFGFSLSPLDSMIVALGRTGCPDVIEVLLRKADTLPEAAEFSHFRALTLAFEAIPDPRAVPRFTRFLKAVQGGARQSIAEQLREVPESDVDTLERNRELKELLLARGLFACGDPDGVAETVLRAYSQDLHGHYARHARSLLENRDTHVETA